jgi:hypothetical protein
LGPSGTISISSPTTSVSRIYFGGDRAFDLGGLTLNGTIVLEANASANAAIRETLLHGISGSIRGNGTIEKTGDGSFEFRSYSGNDYKGALVIREGTLLISNDNQLGYISSSEPAAIFLAGGVLAMRDSTPYGILHNIDNAAGTSGTISIGSMGTLALSYPITGGGTLNIIGQHWLPDQDVPTSNASSGTINSFSGTLNLAVPLTLKSAASFRNISELVLGDKLTSNNTGVSSTVYGNRLSDTATIILRGGVIAASGGLGDARETVGPIIVDAGSCNITYGGPPVSIPSLTRNNRAILTLGSSQRVTTPVPLSGDGAAGTPDVGIVPWIRRNQFPATPMTYQGTSLRILASSEYITAIPAGVTASNLKLDGGGTITAPATVNSLSLWNGDLRGSQTLTITSGAIFTGLASGPGTLSIYAPIDFGTAEGILHGSDYATGGGRVTGPQRLRMLGPISGTNGLTIAGTVYLGGTSTYTGQTVAYGELEIDAADVTPGVPGPLGVDTSPLRMACGAGSVTLTIGSQDTPAVHFGRDIDVETHGSGTAAIWSSYKKIYGNDTITGNIRVTGMLSLNNRPHAVFDPPFGIRIEGNISGTGRLSIRHDVELAGDNSFTGGLDIKGLCGVETSTALGAGPVRLSGGEIDILATSPLSIDNSLAVLSGSRLRFGHALTLSGPVDFQGTLRVAGGRDMLIFNQPLTGQVDILDEDGSTAPVRLRQLRSYSATIRCADAAFLPDDSDTLTSISEVLNVANGRLDLTNNDLISRWYSSQGYPLLDGLRQALSVGRLYTSLTDGTRFNLGYAANRVLGLSTYRGLPVDSGQYFVSYTFTGDSNLDGEVDLEDLTALASHWQSTNQYWTGGDFNYDSIVNIDDLQLLANNWEAGVVNPTDPPLKDLLASLGLPPVEVPEPSIIVICAVAAGLRRRRD